MKLSRPERSLLWEGCVYVYMTYTHIYIYIYTHTIRQIPGEILKQNTETIGNYEGFPCESAALMPFPQDPTGQAAA